MSNSSKKKKFKFPSAFTVLFIVLIFASFLTYVIPAGLYDKLQYNADNTFTITKTNGETNTVKATQDILRENHIDIPLKNFVDGSIKKPIAIPNTYKKIHQSPQGPLDILYAPIKGVTESVDIIIFVLIMGGIVGLLNKTGTFNAGMAALSKKTKGREFLMIAIVFILIALGGTTFGLAEETIALYPILLPVFIATGYVTMVVIATLYLGSSVGTMFSTVNPFSVVIASNAAGISFNEAQIYRLIGLVLSSIITIWYIRRYATMVKNDPSKSIIADEMPRIRERFLSDYDPNNSPEFTFRMKLSLLLFVSSFVVMIWGVQSQGWWFSEMSALFLAVSIIIMFLSGFEESKAVSVFIQGASELVGVALIIGVARGTNIILDSGYVSDSLLHYATNFINGMSGTVFAWVQMAIFSVMGIFIPSSSGLATLAMPIMAPLADTVHVGRDVVVSAYNFGQGWMSYITPAGLIIASLEMVGITYDKWLKWVSKLLVATIILALIILSVQTIFSH